MGSCEKLTSYFGTDGIRGHMGTYPITPEFILKLGWAAGEVLGKSHPKPSILIGKDTRVSGYLLESALESGLSASGVNVCLLGPMPTPAIAYLTRTLRAQAGIVISASHNPYFDNGIKFFSPNGHKLNHDTEHAIEQKLKHTMRCVPCHQLGKAERLVDAPGRYIEFCKNTIPSHISFTGLHLIVDCANGATYHIAPQIFHELGAKVTPLHNKPNGLNINHECGSTHIHDLKQQVIKTQADLGIALDGDGDRVLCVDAKGQVFDGDDLLYIIATHRKQANLLKGGVVGTLMSNLGLEEALGRLKIPFKRTWVGDRHILAELHKKGWELGGEPSGHIVLLDKHTSTDGLVSALQLLTIMQITGKSAAELTQGFKKSPQYQKNIVLNNRNQAASCIKLYQAAIQEMTKKVKSHQGRLLIRPSGTEPVLRLMMEGHHISHLQSDFYALGALLEKI